MVSGMDIEALYMTLDAAREARGLLWADVAHQAGVSASTLSRLGRGKRLDVDGFADLVRWLGISADEFIPHPKADGPPELEVQLALMLSARADLLPEDREFLHEILSVAVKRIRGDRRYA